MVRITTLELWLRVFELSSEVKVPGTTRYPAKRSHWKKAARIV
jgi:hypothetical protein